MIEQQLQHKIDTKTKPPGSLGILEQIAKQIGQIQHTLTPELKNPAILVFAADHGLANEGVSPFPKEVTYQMVLNFLNKGAAINIFCDQNNIDLKVVDAGVDFDFDLHPNLIYAKIAKGTKNMLFSPAMTIRQCKEALEIGAKLVRDLNKKGTNVVGFGEMGIGNTSAAALLMSKYCNLPINECVGKGTGCDEKMLEKKLDILTTITDKYEKINSPKEVLATFGGFEIAMITGGMLQAMENKMVIMVDGFIATSALLAAHAIDESVIDNCIFCHSSNEQGHKKMLDFLNVKAILNLEMCLGEGTGAAVAYPILEAAVNFLNRMSSFDEEGVSNK